MHRVQRLSLADVNEEADVFLSFTVLKHIYLNKQGYKEFYKNNTDETADNKGK